jgi:CubicO group peptidase (beta-lactamase class C family)
VSFKSYLDYINTQGLRVKGIVVLKNGKTLMEHHWVKETPGNVYSVSKSFTSIAAGMAIGEGKLSLKDRVIDAFPGIVANPGERLKNLRLGHLLCMSRGYGEFSRPLTVEEALSQPLSFDPGAQFVYDNGSTFLASAMITRATGQKVRDYLLDRLFRPLGIPDPFWQESLDGYTIGASGLELTVTSLASFGQFLLGRGIWEGNRLVSESWIDTATRTHIATGAQMPPDNNLGYGYCFWTTRHGAYRADGKLGQFVVVLPWQNSVAAITSEEENMHPILYALWDHILPDLEL